LLSHAQSGAHTVAVVTSNNESIYQEVTRSIAGILAGGPSNNVELSFINVGNNTRAEEISRLLSGHDLVVSVGVSATNSVSSLDARPPLLAVLIPLQTAQSIIQSSSASAVSPGQWTSAIVLDQPIERQLHLISLITKGTKSIGILLSPSTGYSKEEIAGLSKRFNMDIYTEMVNSGDNIIRELGFVLEKADIFLAVPDPFVFNRQTAGNLLQSAYRRRTPVIGFAYSHVKAGALAAVYSSPEQIGRHAGEAILEYFSSAENGLNGIQSPRYFSVAFNRQVERSLGLSMPDEADIELEIYSLEHSLEHSLEKAAP
jgi:ABC-type uncharacterized transport system substrate-binding protein